MLPSRCVRRVPLPASFTSPAVEPRTPSFSNPAPPVAWKMPVTAPARAASARAVAMRFSRSAPVMWSGMAEMASE